MISKNKIIDSKKDRKNFLYNKIKHEESSILCEHCQMKRAEESLVDHIKKHNDNETTESRNNKGIIKKYTFKSLTVKRGKFDDVIGWSITWQ